MNKCDKRMTILPLISMINRQFSTWMWQNVLLMDFRAATCTILVKWRDKK